VTGVKRALPVGVYRARVSLGDCRLDSADWTSLSASASTLSKLGTGGLDRPTLAGEARAGLDCLSGSTSEHCH